ncbi:MAG: tRNA 2-thiouridine(34) synthase MnmA [Deltaproteobacteria bacterium]|nr:tRNA 2-thiouridine(34) synthase MnmA [Deltaproteobacteria bacterium]
MKPKVLVAMSGGVDSSVAAVVLKEAGFEVIGASMHLTSCHRPTDRSCCSALDRLDAKRVCETIGVPYVSLDYRERFKRDVIEPFIRDYAQGRTPIPCVQCNSELKFSALFDEMEKLGATSVATGHYARVDHDAEGRYRLLRGHDRVKDQSYYLYALTQKELSRLKLPIGDLEKRDVRELARRFGLVTAEKPDSQEICFVTNGDYVSFLEESAADRLPHGGHFVDRDGKVLGRHEGIYAYTIGQRRGLGMTFGKPMYVLEIRPATNEVVLGSDDDLLADTMTVEKVSWMHPAFADTCGEGMEVQIRAQHRAASARVVVETARKVRVTFAEPQRAIAPGQVAAFYRGEEMLGGGVIQ